MPLDPGVVVGSLGGIALAAVAVVQALQKGKLDALTTAQENLKLKQEQIEAWKQKAEAAEKEAAALKLKVVEQEGDIKELRSMVMLEKIPPALQAILDKVIELVSEVRSLVRSETGDPSKPSEKAH